LHRASLVAEGLDVALEQPGVAQDGDVAGHVVDDLLAEQYDQLGARTAGENVEAVEAV
jgi:hypothetical protein